MKMKHNPMSRRRMGFSLVEVLMAVGIAATSMALLIGLLPAGLSTFREAMNTTVTSQIGQRLLYEAAQTDYNVLTQEPLTKPWRYFDDEGGELQDARGAIFHVVTRVEPTTTIPGPQGGVIQKNLASVIVQVVHNAEDRPIPQATVPASPGDPPEGTVEPDSRFDFVTFTGHVAKNL